MQYDENDDRVYGEFKDLMGQRITIKKAADDSYADGCAQIGVGGAVMKTFFYPTRENVAVMMAALAAYMADTDGVPDLPEPDVEG